MAWARVKMEDSAQGCLLFTPPQKQAFPGDVNPNGEHSFGLKSWGWGSAAFKTWKHNPFHLLFPSFAVTSKLFCWYMFKKCFLISQMMAALNVPVVVNYIVIPKPIFFFLESIKQFPEGPLQ